MDSFIVYLLYQIISGSVLFCLIEKLYKKIFEKLKNPFLHFALSLLTLIPVFKLVPNSLFADFKILFDPYISVYIFVIFILVKLLLRKVRLSVLLVILLMLIFFYPKYSGERDIYAADNQNKRCSCLGFKTCLWGIDSCTYMCFGVPYSCIQVKSGLSVDSSQTPTLDTTVDPDPEIPKPPEGWKTYSNDRYRFYFFYPQEWEIESTDESHLLVKGIAQDHLVYIRIEQITGFGYCYEYGKEKEITVDDKTAKTADGFGRGQSENCDAPVEIMSKLRNTYVLIPMGDEVSPQESILIDYDYPINDFEVAKIYLDQIISTWKFLE